MVNSYMTGRLIPMMDMLVLIRKANLAPYVMNLTNFLWKVAVKKTVGPKYPLRRSIGILRLETATTKVTDLQR